MRRVALRSPLPQVAQDGEQWSVTALLCALVPCAAVVSVVPSAVILPTSQDAKHVHQRDTDPENRREQIDPLEPPLKGHGPSPLM
jgi:hypothetical protein